MPVPQVTPASRVRDAATDTLGSRTLSTKEFAESASAMDMLQPAILSPWSAANVSTTRWDSTATLVPKDIMEMQSWVGPMTVTRASAL